MDNDSLLFVLFVAEKHFLLELPHHQILDFDQGDILDGHFVDLEQYFADPGSVVGEEVVDLLLNLLVSPVRE